MTTHPSTPPEPVPPQFRMPSGERWAAIFAQHEVPVPAICTDTYLTTRDFDSINETLVAYGDARARHAVQRERERVVGLVGNHTAVSSGYSSELSCSECDWEGYGHDEHLVDLIRRGEHEGAGDE